MPKLAATLLLALLCTGCATRDDAATSRMLGASRAPDTPRSLARIADDSPVAAIPGWIAWSTEEPAGSWRLVTLHDGRVTRPPVAPRHRQFDLDLGTDGAGAPVATFSRCAYTRTKSSEDEHDCRLRVVDLVSGAERDAGVPTPPGTSDTSPSMWRGEVAFSRYVPHRNPDVTQLRLFSPPIGTIRELGFGPVGHCRQPNQCRGGNAVGGGIARIDLGPELVAYTWSWGGGDAYGFSEYEVLGVRLADGHSVVGGGGFQGEVCTEGIDNVSLDSPVVHRNRVLFAESDSECYESRSFVSRFDPSSRRGARARERGLLTQIASDGRRLYGVYASKPKGESDPGCSHASPCRLRLLSEPRYGRASELPRR